MSRWSAKNRDGKNLAVENSFRITYKNNTAQERSYGLFGLGSINTTPNQTTTFVNLFLNFNLTGIVNPAIPFFLASFLANTGIRFYARVNNVLTLYAQTIIPAFTGLSSLPSLLAAANITDPFGNTLGKNFIQAHQNQPIGYNGFVDFNFPDIVVDQLEFIAPIPAPSIQSIARPNEQGIFTYSIDPPYPFILIKTDTSVSTQSIEQSGIDNSFGILGIDIYSEDATQVIQGIDYTFKDVNGDSQIFSADPIVDPYQPSISSVQGVDLEKMQINQETTITYNLRPLATANLTINYVKFSIWDFYEFDRVFAQQLRDDFLLQRKLLSADRARNLQIQ